MKYLRQLDGLRGLCILFVFIGHWSTGSIKNLIPWGNIGVYTFFVLSGYLITAILLNAKTKKSPKEILISFWKRRILRIFPIYYITIVLLWAFHYPPVADYITYHFLYLTNFSLLMPGGFAKAIAHLWSLSVEAQFYVLWPLVVLALKNTKVLYACFLLIGISSLARMSLFAMGMAVPEIKFVTLSSLVFLAFGALLAVIKFGDIEISSYVEKIIDILFPIAIVGILTLEILRHIGFQNILFYVVESSCLALALAGLIRYLCRDDSGPLKAFLCSGVLCFLGRISYGLYLYHYLISNLLSDFLRSSNLINFPNTFSGVLVHFSLFFVLSFAIAVLSYNLIEQPLLKLKRYA